MKEQKDAVLPFQPDIRQMRVQRRGSLIRRVIPAGVVFPAKSKGIFMAIHAPPRVLVRGFIAVLAATCLCQAFARAASLEPDPVSLSESTTRWSTVKYATNAENGFISGSLDKTTIVDRTLKTYVIENRYLKVTLVREFGGRILAPRSGRESPELAASAICRIGLGIRVITVSHGNRVGIEVPC